MTAPFKIVAYEPGAANVVDRATGEKVGWVQAAAANWLGFSFAGGDSRMLPAEEGDGFIDYRFDTRRAAAQAVWDARKVTP